MDDKKKMASVINDFLEPIRRKRAELLKDPGEIYRGTAAQGGRHD